jgi:hypothetical protein
MIAFRNRGPVLNKHTSLCEDTACVTHLDGLRIKTKALLLVGQEVLDILALISLELDDLTHLGVCDYGSIAGEFLLDDLEDLLLVELLRQALNGSQGLASIALCVVSARAR